MLNHTQKPYTLSIKVELRFLGIPTRWTPRDTSFGERMLHPAVSQRVGRGLATINNAQEIRTRFFKMERDEASALKFLNQVGVWDAVADLNVAVRSDGMLVSGRQCKGTRDMLLMGAFGHQHFAGYARELTLDELWAEHQRWKKLLANPAKLFVEFGPPPSGKNVRPIDKDMFAIQTRFGNTLQVHLECEKNRYPRAVIQPITGKELLIALAWIDLVSGARFQICAKCGNEFTGRKRTYCDWNCEHASTVSRWRKKQEAKGKKVSLPPKSY
jgi:hypothetical protein